MLTAAGDKSLMNTPVSQLGVKCKGCGRIIAPEERPRRCGCGLIRVEADGEVISVRHNTRSEHGARPFVIDRRDVLEKGE